MRVRCADLTSMRLFSRPFSSPRVRPAASGALVAGAIAWLLVTASGPSHAAAVAPATHDAPRTSSVSAAQPAWSDLSTAQKAALAPLQGLWTQISAAQRRKWITLAAQFDQLSSTERERLHMRMAQWAALSPAERARARLNFADLPALPADSLRAKWDAYNALSEHEKRRLAQRGTPAPGGAAIAARPTPGTRIARIPQSRPDEKPLPRIAASPDLVDHNTLLPMISAQ